MLSKRDLPALLRRHGMQPSAQRLAVAEYVLATDQHPTADEVLVKARQRLPMISRATVYNTLHTLCEKGLLRQWTLSQGKVVYDCNVAPHHHFVDIVTGAVDDVPWSALRVVGEPRVKALGYDVEEYMVVMRGKKRRARAR